MHRLIQVGQQYSLSDANALAGGLIVSRAHGLQTGDAVRFSESWGTLEAGDYYVIRVNPNRIRLATTYQAALSGTAISTPVGIGASFERISSIDTHAVQVTAANRGNIISIGAAAAIVSNSKTADTAAQDPAENVGGAGGNGAGVESVADDVSNNSTGRKSGIAIAGIASWNQIDDVTVAQINDGVHVRTSDIAVAQVAANNTTSIYGLAGALSIAKADDTAIGIAGAFSRNLVRQDTRAALSDADWSGLSTLDVTATHAGTIGGLTIGVAGSKTTAAAGNQKKKGVAIGGSVSWNTVETRTLATLETSQLEVNGPVKIASQDSSRMIVIGGGAGVALNGQLGFGAGVAVNVINSETGSSIDRTDIQSQLLDVTAISNPTIVAVAVAAGVGQIGVAGMLAINTVNPSANATVNQSIVDVVDGITVSATEYAEIYSDGGGVAVGIKKAKAGDDSGAVAAAFGIGVAINEIGAQDGSGVFANLTRSTILGRPNVTVTAQSNAFIQSLALAGSVAVASQSGEQKGSTAIAGAGAATRNVISTEIVALSQNTHYDDAQ
ncbi:MAG: hypothetical protein KDB23_30830, partial [Planctomycetales bacterium]|nr:hypothetical protein [Planctomycetales bacterium]